MPAFDESKLADEVTNGAWRSSDGRFYELPSRQPKPIDRDAHERLTKIVTALLARVGNDDPYLALQALAALRRHVDEVEAEVVALARWHRWSWASIATMIGLSRSAAYRRYGLRR